MRCAGTNKQRFSFVLLTQVPHKRTAVAGSCAAVTRVRCWRVVLLHAAQVHQIPGSAGAPMADRLTRASSTEFCEPCLLTRVLRHLVHRGTVTWFAQLICHLTSGGALHEASVYGCGTLPRARRYPPGHQGRATYFRAVLERFWQSLTYTHFAAGKSAC